MNLETQKLTKRIQIHQSEITIHELLNPLSKVLFPKRSVKMIDGSEQRNRQLAFELQNRMFMKSAVKGDLTSHIKDPLCKVFRSQ